MYLCEVCEEGKLEMCQYFKEHFLESGAAVTSCPKFRPDSEEVHVEVMNPVRADKVRILTCRTMRKALAGERVLLLTNYKAAQAERLLRAIAESDLKGKVASVQVNLQGGGEIWIGGVDHVDQ